MTATTVCENDPEHIETETAQTTYTAAFTDPAFESRTKDIEIILKQLMQTRLILSRRESESTVMLTERLQKRWLADPEIHD